MLQIRIAWVWNFCLDPELSHRIQIQEKNERADN